MRTFTVYRRAIPVGSHVDENPPELPQFQGVVFDDGTCVVRWLTKVASTSVWNSLEDMLLVHSHPEYKTEIRYSQVIA